MGNIDKNQLINAIMSASGGKIDSEALKKATESGDISALMSALPADEQKKLSSALSDKKNLSELLGNAQARAILGAFLKGGKK